LHPLLPIEYQRPITKKKATKIENHTPTTNYLPIHMENHIHQMACVTDLGLIAKEINYSFANPTKSR
jgi:hypothetical protein